MIISKELSRGMRITEEERDIIEIVVINHKPKEDRLNKTKRCH